MDTKKHSTLTSSWVWRSEGVGVSEVRVFISQDSSLLHCLKLPVSPAVGLCPLRGAPLHDSLLPAL